ncbi:MAG: hypothetical protein IT342_12565 [Candidatus Melainabacteria bacterium]|nr:hypothetical protein [Candidatus Melainabacteria bacterium]
MFAAWRYEENGLDEWMERKLGPRLSRFARTVVVTILDIVAAPIELSQRLFYRPNRCTDKLVVEDLHAKSRNQLKQAYLDSCTQTFYGDKHADIKSDPRSTYENLQACTSGTFKAVDPASSQVADAAGSVPVGPELHRAPNSMSITRMTDSQIISGRPRNLLVRPFRGELAVNEFGATASGTFVPLAGFHKWQQENAPKTPENKASKSGTFPVFPDENPHGLKQFLIDAEIKKQY